ncbi:hypothetical protein BU17DRAFT_78550 [Hysterangium stoloniferum]|nr:hypothetical protein BU17DRAFT_78550 [Hysterangium stoloniferum]
MVPVKDFRVAIVGGGIAGLTLAVGLIRGGVQVDIFEQASKFEEIGAGVGIGPNAVRALKGLGILDDILRVSNEPPSMRPLLFISGLPGRELIYDYPGTDDDLALGVHRAHFLETLVSLLPPEVSHFGKKCISVLEDEGGTTIFFDDGTRHTSDIVIGCDGIKSSIRTTVVGRLVHAKFTRRLVFRGLIPVTAAVAALGEGILKRPHCLVGPNRHIISYPLQGKPIVNVVIFCTDRSKLAEEQDLTFDPPWVVAVEQEEMLEHFVGWGKHVLDLLANIKKPTKWVLHALDQPLDSYIRGKIVLVGDSAHSMQPHLGAGAGQAIEDAYMLTRLLTHPSTRLQHLETVLKAYDHIRRPRANRVLTSSYAAGEVYEYAGPSGGSIEGIRSDLTDQWDFVWHHDLDHDFEMAVQMVFNAPP